MRKSIITVLLAVTFWNLAYAPNGTAALSAPPQPEPIIELYSDLISAVYYVESRCDSMAYNPKENAVGGLQIRQIRLDDYNKRTSKNYSLQEMYEFTKAKEVFLYYARKYEDPETIAKKWNGSGPMTAIYWKKVKSRDRKSVV